MAPELLRGGVADVRCDVFAFGVVLFEFFCGQHPFQRPSIFEIVEAILKSRASAIARCRGRERPALAARRRQSD